MNLHEHLTDTLDRVDDDRTGPAPADRGRPADAAPACDDAVRRASRLPRPSPSWR